MRSLKPHIEDAPACVALRQRHGGSRYIKNHTYRQTFALSQVRDPSILIEKLCEAGASYRDYIRHGMSWILAAIVWNPLFAEGVLDITNYSLDHDVIEQFFRFYNVPPKVLISLAKNGTWYTKLMIARSGDVPVETQVVLCSNTADPNIHEAVQNNRTFDYDVRALAALAQVVALVENDSSTAAQELGAPVK